MPTSLAFLRYFGGLATFLALSSLHAQTADDYINVPLSVYNFSDSSGGPSYKLGITLTLGSGASQSTQLYEFDTGGTGFYAGYQSPDTWAYTPTGTNGVTQTYASGNTYTANVVNTTVTFVGATSSSGAPVELAATGSGNGVAVGLITSATNASKGANAPINHFNESIQSGTAPLDNYFYGDFGMSLGSANGLSAIVPQLPGNLNTGFIVKSGTYPGANTSPGPVGSGTLQIGLTAADRDPANWATVIYFSGSSTGQYPYSLQNLYQEVLVNGQLTLSGSTATSATYSSTSVASGVVFDTGAPTTMIHTGSTGAGYAQVGDFLYSGTGSVLLGDTVSVTASGTSVLTGDGVMLDVTSGTDLGLNEVKTGTADAINYPGIYVNTGLSSFFGNDVLFDLADGWIGIRPTTIPEPGSIAMAGLGLAALALRWARRRDH